MGYLPNPHQVIINGHIWLAMTQKNTFLFRGRVAFDTAYIFKAFLIYFKHIFNDFVFEII